MRHIWGHDVLTSLRSTFHFFWGGGRVSPVPAGFTLLLRVTAVMNIDIDHWSLDNTADRLYFMFVTTLFHRRHLFVLIYESKSTQTDDVCEIELW